MASNARNLTVASPQRQPAILAIARKPAVVADDLDATRTWLQLMNCATLIRQHIGRKLRQEFALSIARFEFMAQLEAHPDGLKMFDISRRLMVTSGNITALTDQLDAAGLVQRQAVAKDRRVCAVRLTPAGREKLAEISVVRGRWIDELFDALAPDEHATLHELLGRLMGGVRRAVD